MFDLANRIRNTQFFAKAETKAKAPWVLEKIKKQGLPSDGRILDISCGTGLLSNALASEGFHVTGVDLSPEKLRQAQIQDTTGSVRYIVANPSCLPFTPGTFDVVTAMDFWQREKNPEQIINEVSRVLKPGGLFFYHSFNRNFISEIFATKIADWFGPKQVRLGPLPVFPTPSEVAQCCLSSGMLMQEKAGINPVFSSVPIKSYWSGSLPETMQFKVVKSTLLTHMGFAKKFQRPHSMATS
jgi:2-polyprenyl-6-hydroxyphenyl methylase/3-demethylubiquinone-9 3-methyltransferase